MPFSLGRIWFWLRTLLILKTRGKYSDHIMVTFWLQSSVSTGSLQMQTSGCCWIRGVMRHLLPYVRLTTLVFGDVNHLVSAFVREVTMCIRLSSQLNCDSWQPTVGSIPFPRPHFIATDFEYFGSHDSQQYCVMMVPELTQQKCNAEDMTCAIDLRLRYPTFTLLFRGCTTTKETDVQALIHFVLDTRSCACFGGSHQNRWWYEGQ